METSKEKYGVECFDKLNSDQIEHQTMGIFVDINTGPMRNSPSRDSDIDLAIRRSVDEELALSEDDSSNESTHVTAPLTSDGSQTTDVPPEKDAQPRRTSYKSESEEENSDSDLSLNQTNKSKTNRSIVPHNDESTRLSCSEYSSDSSDIQSDSDSRSPFSCRYCDKPFRSNADLTRHVRCHTGERPYQCDHCLKSFNQSAHLQRHLLTHPEKTCNHQCPSCEKSYPLKIQLIGHMAVHSKKDPVTKVKTRFKCEHCSKTFAVHHKYKKHVSAHLNGDLHVCEVCGRAFKMQSYLVVHMRTHSQAKVYTGDRPFSCGVCGKSFLSNSNLELHSTIHKYEKTSFPCELCGKEFSRKSNYVAHSKSHYRQESANYILKQNASYR